MNTLRYEPTGFNGPSTEALPDHVETLRTYLESVGGEIVLNDQGIFNAWRVTWLPELDIYGAVDFLVSTGAADRDGGRVKLRGVPR